MRHISQKSVDYLICDKSNRRPLPAIELDDWSHDSKHRQRHDANVAHILQEAGLPLLQPRDVRNISADEIASRIDGILQVPRPGEVHSLLP